MTTQTGARAGGGPGHPVHLGQDAAIRQSRLSRGRDRAALSTPTRPCRRRSTCSPSTAWGMCIRASPASCSSHGASERAIRSKFSRSCRRASRACRRRWRCRSRRRRCRDRPVARRCSSSSPPHATFANWRTCWPMSRSRRARAGCSSSPTPISASRRRRSSSISTTTRRTGSASPWPISATRSPRCSAATTSTCSTCTGGAIRSSLRCRANTA